MKHLLAIFLLTFTVMLTQAQDVKPTKEQTSQYIINTLSKHTENWQSSTVDLSSERSIKDVTIDNCIIKFKIQYKNIAYDKVGEGGLSYEIPLDKIEYIDFSYNKARSSYSIQFVGHNKTKVINKKQDFIQSNTETKTDILSECEIITPHDEKIIAAFNHSVNFAERRNP